MFSKKIMFVSTALVNEPSGGRDLLSELIYKILQEIYGDNLIYLRLQTNSVRGIKAYLNSLRGYIDGVNKLRIEESINLIRDAGVLKVFIDGSNLGGFTAVLKKRVPEIEVTTFFHNVEARFFFGALRLRKSFHALGVLVVNTLAERKSVKCSDTIICLSERDSKLLAQLYGRSATHISPMALMDKCPALWSSTPRKFQYNFAIFVGGAFYANIEGIEWFVKNVVPKINIPLFIIGRGFESLREKLEISDKVKVVGSVESMDEWYRQAQFVVAPIFDGSGMKTKVAEALMFGKKIIGTPEAFTGYGDALNKAGWVCETPEDFIKAINEAQLSITQSFDLELRELYEKHYSMNAAYDRFQKILSKN